MEMDMQKRRELARKGGTELMDLNRTFKSIGQAPVSMNADQLIAFYQWLENKRTV